MKIISIHDQNNEAGLVSYEHSSSLVPGKNSGLQVTPAIGTPEAARASTAIGIPSVSEEQGKHGQTCRTSARSGP